MTKRFLLFYIFALCACRHSTVLTTVAIPEDYVKLGAIKWKDSLEYNFIIRNSGEHDLFLKKISAYCDCASFNWSKGPIKPGAVGFVHLKINPADSSIGVKHTKLAVNMNTKEMFKIFTVEYNIN
ncbi:DUF1573 domain-containing protein [Mucilaginibacter sp.]